ncbi:MAG: leucine-rich repeat protein, partial [Clostridia bacterium]|nr:leucine-rich repeat protein [Clostridia bacterium]
MGDDTNTEQGGTTRPENPDDGEEGSTTTPEEYTQGLEYELSTDETCYTVTGIGTCADTDIVIPSMYNGKPVTNIYDLAFRDCYGLTSVVIGDSVTSIGDWAFSGCSGLTS